MRTLVLNASYEPIHLVSWEEAMCMIVGEKADIVKAYEGKQVRSAFETFEMPKIIKLRKYARVKKNLSMVRYSRRNIVLRDENTCQYCGKKTTGKDATLDHVVPKSRGGKSTWTNIVLSCHSCNNKKDNRTPEEAGMKLKRQPYKPKAKTKDLESILKEFDFSFDV